MSIHPSSLPVKFSSLLRRLVFLAASITCVVLPAQAERLDDILARVNDSEKLYLQSLDVLKLDNLTAMQEVVSKENLRALTEEILAETSMAVGRRKPDENGWGTVHHFVKDRLDGLENVEFLGELRNAIPVPVLLEDAQNVGDRKNRKTGLVVDGQDFTAKPFWPNGALANLCPDEGLTGQFVYIRDGEWDDMNGLDIKGSIVLMNFKGGRNWNRAMALGAQAVVVIEDDFVSRRLAEGMFANTPLPFPRFMVDRNVGAALIEKASRKTEAGEVIGGTDATLHGGNLFENRPVRSLFAWLPPQDSLNLTVHDADLISRIAADQRVGVDEIVSANRLDSRELKVGQELDIPGRVATYTVKDRDLLQRLARDYKVSANEILATSGNVDPNLPSGTVLKIPSLSKPMVMMVRLDAVSSVQNASHGAKAAANLALALNVLEHAATSDNVVRRRGLLVCFTDGDLHGGTAARSLTQLMLSREKLKPSGENTGESGLSDAELSGFYEETASWLGDHSQSLSDGAAQWFCETWLSDRLESHRIELAGERVDNVLAMLNAQSSQDKGQVTFYEARAQQVRKRVDTLVNLRKSTLMNEKLSFESRVNAFIDRVDELSTPIYEDAPSLSASELEELMNAQVRQERKLQARREANAKIASKLLTVLHGIEKVESDTVLTQSPIQSYLMDLSFGSIHMGFGAQSDFRGNNAVSQKAIDSVAGQFDRVNAFASKRAEWPEEWSFLGKDIAADFPLMSLPRAPTYSEMYLASGLTLLAVETRNDRQTTLDTPWDTLDHVNFGNFAIQARTAALLLLTGLESARDSEFPGKVKPIDYARLVGNTFKFNVRSGIDAKDPVPNTLVYYPARRKNTSGGFSAGNSATCIGMRPGVMTYSLLNGRFTLPVEVAKPKGLVQQVRAYRQDPVSGLFDMLMEGGQIGTKEQKETFKLIAKSDAEKTIIMTDLYPKVVSPGVEPLEYKEPRNDLELVKVQDAVLNGAPRHYNIEHPRLHFGEQDLMGTIVYMEPGRMMRLIDDRKGTLKGLLIGPISDEKDLKGDGYEVGPTDASRNLFMAMSVFNVAEDIQNLSEGRMRIYNRFGIRDKGLSDAIAVSRAKLEQAKKFKEEKQWQAAIGASRECWGILVKNYPEILRLGKEAVFSVVIIMGLLVPAAYFLERLIIGSKHIISRLGGTVALFVVGTLFLSRFHPAFQIALSPFIVVIAFVMILMGSIVLGICYQRFEVLVRRARIEGGEAESEEISLASSLATAFSLGVSNLKKRPTRTVLTAFTVTVLTFSIVSFVSVKGKDTLFARTVAVDTNVGKKTVAKEELLPIQYEGVLFRDGNWAKLSQGFVDAVGTEFGRTYDIVRRTHYIEIEGGNNASREGKNQIEIRLGKKSSIVTALMGYEPEETEFSGLNRAVSGQTWFQGGNEEKGIEGDRFHLILPSRVAEELGVEASQLVDANGHRLPDEQLPQVMMMNNLWRVIGVLDEDTANKVRDVNGKSLALIDFIRSAATPKSGETRIEVEGEHFHMDWTDLAIVPVSAKHDVRAGWNSVALKFPEGHDFQSFRDDLSLRMDRAIFSHVDGSHSMLSAKKERSIAGLAKILVPIILCVLIVSNTMMGTVDERIGEVQMLGAIGLSPNQISFLLLAESTVFSCLGIILGTFAGLAFSKIAGFFPETLGLLSFNFTSLASTGLAIGTGVIVLVATLIPARRAAALAAPSGMDKWELPDPSSDGTMSFMLPFTLTRGNALGMAAFFRRFLLNHADSSSQDFISRSVVLKQSQDGQGLELCAHMWLAPYDLDVAQDLVLVIHPTGNEGVFGVTISLHRSSGTEDAWVRTNYGFLDLVRRQFLLWRNLETSQRKRYIEEGAKVLQSGKPDVGADTESSVTGAEPELA